MVFIWLSLLYKSKKNLYKAKYTSSFLFCLNPLPNKTLKEAAAKSFFSSEYVIVATSFNECFWSHVITRRRYFFPEACCYFKIFSTAILLFSLKQVFWQASILHYLHNNNTVLIPKFQNTAIVYYTYTW